jgi:hypothetical protein
MNSKIRILDLSIIVTIASTTLYIVFRNLGRELGSFAFLWAPVTLLLIIASGPKTFIKGPNRILLLYGVLMVGILQYTLWKYMNDWNRIRILYEFYYLVILTAILSYYLSKGDFIRLAWISKWTFIFILISLITTNIALFIDPYVIRDSAKSGALTPFQEKIYKISGAIGYSYAQAIIYLIPILIYHIKSKKRMVFSPNILIVILILIIITEIRSQVFANILVTALILLFSLFGSKKMRSTTITISLIGILFFTIPSSFYSNIFKSLSSNFDPNSEIYYKLHDFSKFIDNPEFKNTTASGGRAARYPLLYKALAANPLWGHASSESNLNISGGAHLYWMNRLALWGIPGFLFFIYVLFKIYKSISSLFDRGYRIYYFISVTAFVLIGLTKAVGDREPWLMLIVVIPGFYFLPLLQQTNEGKPIDKDNSKVKRLK